MLECVDFAREDVENFSDWCDIEEDVDWCFENLSQSFLVDISCHQLLHSLEGKVANISKDQSKQYDICESLHVLGEAALLFFWR